MKCLACKIVLFFPIFMLVAMRKPHPQARARMHIDKRRVIHIYKITGTRLYMLIKL